MGSDASIQRLLSMFPTSYCTFEVILLARFLYFLLFNVINTIALTYVLNDDKERVAKSEEMRRNQIDLTDLAGKIFEKISGETIRTNSEIVKKEYVKIKNKTMKEMNLALMAAKTGKTEEELKKKNQSNWMGKL